MREIKIFLASSIEEVRQERMELVNFMYSISRDFERLYDIRITPLWCENFDDAYVSGGKQSEYNEALRDANFAFFIFFKKAGQFTREEFAVARKSYEDTEKPKIYTYFKDLGDEKPEDSLREFMDELGATLGHYYGTFSHIDTVKLRILLSIKLRELDFIEVKVEEGECQVDGVSVLSLKNVAEFANNKELQELFGELSAVEDAYLALKPRALAGECTDEEYSEYAGLAAKRAGIKDRISTLQRLIFNMSVGMSREGITSRQAKAYRLCEQGDYKGALAILDFDEIKDDYRRGKEVFLEQVRTFVREGKARIDVLMLITSYGGRFDEIDSIYREITREALSFRVELHTVYAYMDFLCNQRRGEEAISLGEELLKVGFEDQHMVENLLGICRNAVGDYKGAEESFLRSVKLREALYDKDKARYEETLALGYNSLGTFFDEHNRPKSAEEFYLKAYEMRDREGKAETCTNLCGFYTRQRRFEDALEMGKTALSIFTALYHQDSRKHAFQLVRICNSMAVLADLMGEGEGEYYRRAREICRELYGENPCCYGIKYADLFINEGAAHIEKGDVESATELLNKGREIAENLIKLGVVEAKVQLASVCNNMAKAYLAINHRESALEQMEKAVEIYGELYTNDSEYFAEDYATACCNFAVISKDGDALATAIDIRERLYRSNPPRYENALATALIVASGVAKGEFLKWCAALSGELYGEAPNVFCEACAVLYFNYGVEDGGKEYLDKAFSIAKRYSEKPLCRAVFDAMNKEDS